MASSNVLYSNCRQSWDSSTCAFANVCGLTATAIFIIVYLPQMYRNFRHRSVKGLSPYWSLSNFTASINNLFFVFNVKLPLFNKIGACYAPLVHGTLLCQFFIFTPHTRNKIIVTCSFLTLWLTIILLQSFLDIYEYMQWMSVVLWSVSSYPQVVLNMKRCSTQGLSVIFLALRQSSMILWFFATYFLAVPIQNYILSFFSGTAGYLMALQIIYFWKQPPKSIVTSESSKSTTKMITGDEPQDVENDETGKGARKDPSKTCNIIRVCLAVLPVFFLIAYIVAIVWSLHTFYALFAPIGVYIILFCFYIYFNETSCIALRLKGLLSCCAPDDTYTVKL